MDDKKINEIINELYNNENISLGVHGTSILPSKKEERISDICQNGLMCRYNDLRRTVSFQDRGYIHAHGNINLNDILNYKYEKQETGYTYVEHKEDSHASYSIEKAKLEQCTFLVAIPKAMSTIDSELFGDKKDFRRDYATSEDKLKIGETLNGRPLLSKYIVGYYTNGDLSSFTPNENFYGFISHSKDPDFPNLDLESISQANEEAKKREEQKEIKSTQQLGKETLEQQKNTKSKNKISNFLNRIIEKMKNKNQEREER